MNARSFLELEVMSKPLEHIPNFENSIILGTEHELGMAIGNCWDLEKKEISLTLPGFVSNGGRIYMDCSHIEICTPETRNPFQTLVYEKAMELLCLKGEYVSRIYKNNVDNNGNTWGAHENYFTSLKDAELYGLIPFFVTRQIMTGAGRQNGGFHISQRASFICQNISHNTIQARGIICIRQEEEYKGRRRIHIIVNEGNMCEGAILLKLGTARLMFELAEQKKLPKKLAEYDLSSAVEDIRRISESTSNWQLSGIKMKATELQYLCYEACNKHYKGRDEGTDIVLKLWSDTLEKLERDPRELFGRLDWVTKKLIFDSLQEEGEIKEESLKCHDIEYHNISREEGLFFLWQKAGKIEKYFSDKLIERAMYKPPRDTRAFFRGNLIKKLNGKPRRYQRSIDWHVVYKGAVIETDLSDPYNSYEHLNNKEINNE